MGCFLKPVDASKNIGEPISCNQLSEKIQNNPWVPSTCVLDFPKSESEKSKKKKVKKPEKGSFFKIHRHAGCRGHPVVVVLPLPY
jgi:hypothetical protein